MTPRAELALTIAVCAIGFAYFGWRLLTAEGDRQLLYIGMLILGAILAHRAIKDVRARAKRSAPDREGDERRD